VGVGVGLLSARSTSEPVDDRRSGPDLRNTSESGSGW
jgi:hypothetical protein